MNPRIGLFDSGVGGFTVLKQLLQKHGDISCVYLADTARVPYGNKSPKQIRTIAHEVVHWLKEDNVSAVVVACNTTNSLALDVVQNISQVPVFGLIKAAAHMIDKDCVGVLATSATVKSNEYKKQIQALRPGTIVIEQSCPAFVPMIESGNLFVPELRELAIQYLKPLLDARVQAVVLGCSHYPLIHSLLLDLLPPDVRIIDPAVGLARQMDVLFGQSTHNLNSPNPFANTRFCATSDPEGFAQQATTWLGQCPEVELVTLRSKAYVS